VAAHGFSDGDQVRVDGAVGNTAANGLWTVAGATTNTFQLAGSVGNGAYAGGGIVSRINGLSPGAEVGRRLIVIAGVGRGQRKKIADNTTTSVTVDSDFIVPLDSTSRYIIVDSSPLATIPSIAAANSDPATKTTIDILVDNFANQSLAVVAYAVDVDGNRSFDYLAQWREIFQFGQPLGTRLVTADTSVLLTDRTLLVDSSADH